MAQLGFTPQPRLGLVLSAARLWLGLALLHRLDWDLCLAQLGSAQLWLGLALLHSLDWDLRLAWLGSKALAWLGLAWLGLGDWACLG